MGRRWNPACCTTVSPRHPGHPSSSSSFPHPEWGRGLTEPSRPGRADARHRLGPPALHKPAGSLPRAASARGFITARRLRDPAASPRPRWEQGAGAEQRWIHPSASPPTLLCPGSTWGHFSWATRPKSRAAAQDRHGWGHASSQTELQPAARQRAGDSRGGNRP